MQCEVRPPPGSKTQPKIHSVSNSQRPKLSLQREKQRCEAGSRRGLGKMTNVLSLQVARERTRQAKAASDRQISKLSDHRPRERLEAENAQLRDCVVELLLEIQALHDGAK